jgi:large subunit ribosomal protein L3
MKALITRKVGMTSTIAEDGTMTAVTLLSATPCVITQSKPTKLTAIQLCSSVLRVSSLWARPRLVTSRKQTQCQRSYAKYVSQKSQKTSRLEKQLTPEVFSVGDQVQVTGTSKGKGWAGTIKRHNFHRQRANARW